MADLKNKYGELVYRWEGDRIIDKYGNLKYEIRDNCIYDTYGNRKIEFRGEWLYDTYGNRLGEKRNLVDYLDPVDTPSRPIRTPSSSGGSSDGGGVFGFIFGVILLGFLKALWAFLKGPFVEFSYLGDTAARKEWWGTCVRTILLSFLMVGLFANIILHLGDVAGVIIMLLIIIAFCFLPIIAVSIRRMHDIGKNGWWSVIPLVGFVMCGFFPGTTEGNKYI